MSRFVILLLIVLAAVVAVLALRGVFPVPALGRLWLRRPAKVGPARPPVPAPRPVPTAALPDEPAPPLRAAQPSWPFEPVSPDLARVRLPAPPLQVRGAALPPDHGLAEPALPSMPRTGKLAPDADPAFAEHLLDLRRSGLDVALVIELSGWDANLRRHVDRGVRLARALFPQARFGAVLYGPAACRSFPLATEPETLLEALARFPASQPPATDATGMNAATAAAAGLEWRHHVRRTIIVLSARPPWIAEVPAILDAARRFANQPGAGVHLFTMPAAAAGHDPSGFQRLAADNAVSWTPLADASQFPCEWLSLVLGREHRQRIESLLHDLDQR